MKNPVLIAILGPTASGKTALAIELAEYFGSEIISCDSRQFYREMNIGVARPTEGQLARVKHHFIADRSVHEPLSGGQFEREALEKLKGLFKKNPVQIMAGGSGLFAKALIEGFDDLPKVNPAIREELNELHKQSGLQPLVEELKESDPQYTDEVDLNNPRRIIRALEVIRGTGKAYSDFRLKQPAKRFFDTLVIAPEWERGELYERIDQRVSEMMAAGLEDEARKLYPYRHLTALKTVGYKEFFEYFDSAIPKGEVESLIARNTRTFAKRQMTWNRRVEDLVEIPRADSAQAIAYIESKIL